MRVTRAYRKKIKMSMSTRFSRSILIIVILAATATATAAPSIHGPLRVHPENPRYFTDDSGRAILLAGSHTWRSVQDAAAALPPDVPFDFDELLDLLEKNHHNFTRLWAWESGAWVQPKSLVLQIDPLPYQRTGPGTAADGRPKFDLDRFNQDYFDRLRSRAEAAGKRGIYVGVMFFQGFSVARKDRRRNPSPWKYHPLNGVNNINGINGDTNGDGEGYEVHELGSPEITRIQEAYVRKVVDAVCDLDNVLYEISNESHGGSTQWQYHMIDVIRARDRERGKSHPVWMTFQWDGMAGRGANENLFNSSAEAISPESKSGGVKLAYEKDPPAASGAKVILADTDHINPPDMDRAEWAWKCFARGLHPIFMDNPPVRGNLRHPVLDGWKENGPADRTRKAMGQVVVCSRLLNLATMTPTDDEAECSTRYCLRESGVQYLAYQPASGPITLRVAEGSYDLQWWDPVRGTVGTPKTVTLSAGPHTFTPPEENAAVLCLLASHFAESRATDR